MTMKKSNYNVHSDCTCIGLAHCALRSKRPASTIGDVDDNDNGTRDHSPHCNNSWHVNMPSWLIYMPTSSSSSKLSQPIFFLFTGRHIITTGGGGGTGDANFIFHATLAFWHGMAWHDMHSSPYVIYYLCKILFRPKKLTNNFFNFLIIIFNFNFAFYCTSALCSTTCLALSFQSELNWKNLYLQKRFIPLKVYKYVM